MSQYKDIREKRRDRRTSETYDRMMVWFDYSNLTDDHRPIAKLYYLLAKELIKTCDPGPERTVALRKLLESRDCTMRAMIHPGG